MWIKELVRANNFFRYFCFSLFLLCLLIILWGAWVRISLSGDACGQSWPSCKGAYIISSVENSHVWIEWIHRATSGLFGLVVCLLVIFVFMKFPRKHLLRKIALISLFFTLTEGLIGALLVLSGLTGDNASFAHVLIMNWHLINSLLLASSLFICWRTSIGKTWVFPSSGLVKNKEKVTTDFKLSRVQTQLPYFRNRQQLIIFSSVLLLLVFFGSFSSLSSVLFPSHSLWEGVLLDFSSDSSWLIRLRFLHPLLALIFGGGFVFYYLFQYRNKKNNYSHFQFLIICLLLSLVSGAMNLLLLSPAVLKLLHLLCVYLLVMSVIMLLEKDSLSSNSVNTAG